MREQPEKPPAKAPDGYRLLTEGEIIYAGDIYLRGGQWLLTNQTGGRWNPRGYWTMARKTTPAP